MQIPMMKSTKEQAIEQLQKVLDEIDDLKNIAYPSERFSLWNRNARVAIRHAFGDDSSHVREFSDVEYESIFASRNQIQYYYERGLSTASGILSSMIQEIGTYWQHATEGPTAVQQHTEPEPTPVKTDQVFVVHGRNQTARDAMFTYLRTIGLHPLEWNEAVRATGKTMPYIGEILDAAFTQAGAVVVLMTPDDGARLSEPFRSANDPPHETELTGQARPNVLFEAGMAMGRNPDRTILVELGSLRLFSDVSGLHVIRMDNSSQRRQELAQRLEGAGCPVSLDGIDWHTAGDFDAALSGL